MARAGRDDILASAKYDNDAASLRSLSDHGIDVEEDFEEKSRTTLELNDYDASLLREEEEREKLLAKGTRFDGVKRLFKGSLSDREISMDENGARRQRRRERRGSRRGLLGENAEEGQLMFEMEEGFKDTSSRSSSSDSLRLSREKWNTHEKQVQIILTNHMTQLMVYSPAGLRGDGL